MKIPRSDASFLKKRKNSEKGRKEGKREGVHLYAQPRLPKVHDKSSKVCSVSVLVASGQ